MVVPSSATQASAPASVLVIDDASEIHDLVAVRLRQGEEPVELSHATDADTGLRLAREHPPDVILLDLDLPGGSGLDLCRMLREHERLQSTSIIFLTGTVDVGTKVRAFEAGASDYITKPFDAVELRARVRAALRTTRYRWHLERAARQRATLLELSAAVDSSWEERMRTVLAADADALDVSRVSYWRLIGGGEAIECEALFHRDRRAYDTGIVLHATDYPRYVRALRTAMPVIANDAIHYPDTSEFADNYLRPAGIGAMMDVPVFVRGQLVGVVCHEHVGGIRSWAVDEQQFAVSIGHMLSLAIETADRRRAEAALRVSEARFRAIAHVSPVALVVNSVEGECLWGNPAASALSGIPEAELAGRSAREFYVDAAERAQIASELADHGAVDRREVRMRKADGTEYWALVSARKLTFDEQPAVIVGLADLTEQKRMQALLEHSARHDALTGLPNRVLLFEMLRRELGVAARNSSYRFALLYFDLDRFKPINDAFGHAVGDRILMSVADRLRGSMRPMDVAARVGGDEFALVAADVGDVTEVERIAARLEAEISAPHRIGDHVLVVGASIGIAIGDHRTTDPSALLSAGDEAMYQRKRDRAQAHRER